MFNREWIIFTLDNKKTIENWFNKFTDSAVLHGFTMF